MVRPAATVASRGVVEVGGRALPCALGRGGVRLDKREGDGATPAGDWPFRRILYRPDKVALPRQVLAAGRPAAPILPDDGWCDDPTSPLYNQPVRHPCQASAERLWRTDDLYDILVVLGHNDAPVMPGHGSAIFLHVARPDMGPTEGCIALDQHDILFILAYIPSLRGVRVGLN